MPSDGEALLVGLLEPLGLIDGAVPGHDRRAARRKAKEIGAHGLVGTAVRDVVREVQAAIAVAAVVPAAFSQAVRSSGPGHWRMRRIACRGGQHRDCRLGRSGHDLASG